MNDTWKQLDKISELEEQARFDDYSSLKKHHFKHPLTRQGEYDDYFPDGMSMDDYDDAAHDLSSSEALPLGSGKDNIMGYVNQYDQKTKLRRVEGSIDEMVVYDGGDIDGSVVTYYMKPHDKILQQANPFTAGVASRKYKCDLDGGLEGLKAFTPPKSMSPEEIDDIVYKLENGIPLIED